ncbi:MAG: hypothetical protein WBV73_23150 [Phormidium sp.]
MSINELKSSPDQEKWRLTPGYLSQGCSDFESVHILLGRFLAVRGSVA